VTESVDMPVRSVDLTLFRPSKAAMRHCNIPAAGRALSVSPSAVSRALDHLRLLLKTQLFHLTAYGMAPTPRGNDQPTDTLGKSASILSASANRSLSLPRRPSIPRPTGKPQFVKPIGRLTPGMPALLPGPVLRTIVVNVGTDRPFRTTSSPSLIRVAGIGVVGKTTASTPCVSK